MAEREAQTVTVERVFHFAFVAVIEPAFHGLETGFFDAREFFIKRPFGFSVGAAIERQTDEAPQRVRETQTRRVVASVVVANEILHVISPCEYSHDEAFARFRQYFT
jgi:hypothetical protein